MFLTISWGPDFVSRVWTYVRTLVCEEMNELLDEVDEEESSADQNFRERETPVVPTWMGQTITDLGRKNK